MKSLNTSGAKPPEPGKPRILILSGCHLCNNPRVLKEADALAAAGYDVEVAGAEFDNELAERDRALLRARAWRFTPVVCMTARQGCGRRRGWPQQLRRRVATACFRHLSWSTGWQLGYTAPELLRIARRRRPDLCIGHLEQGLWAVSRLAREGQRVGVDMEDWYSEDLTAAGRRDRPLNLLKRLERQVLRYAAHRTCTSHAMSDALAEAYGCQQPQVIYNVFPQSEQSSMDGNRLDRRDDSRFSIYWFSQTVGPDRGLDDLLAALPQVKHKVEVHLRGNASAEARQWLDSRLDDGTRSLVHVHPPVPNDQLLSRIAEHDLGFAGEIPYCRNKDLTASNKIFHYLLGGLAVVASQTRGQEEVLAACPDAGMLYRPGDSAHLAHAIHQMLDSPGRLLAAKQAAATAARTRFCWELESPQLIASVEAALTADAPPVRAM